MTGIFKGYDIRGKYPDELNEKLVYEIALRARNLGINRIAVGRDARLSSPALHRALIKGLIDTGIYVEDLGIVTSPMHSHYCADNKIFGCMITASHNPSQYNGIKFVDDKGIQQDYDVFLFKIEKLMNKEIKLSGKKGNIKKVDMLSDYVMYIVDKFKGKFNKKIKVVIDCSNGVGGLPLKALDELQINAKIINIKQDGRFPNHGCDQTRAENFQELQKKVLESRADLGIIFDGDADRVAFVDEKANIVSMDFAFLLLALEELKNTRIKQPMFLFDLRYSRVVGEVLKKNGVKIKIMRVGNPFYKNYMHKNKNAIFAGEFSGHLMYKENFCDDDAFYASLKMISLLSKNEEPLSLLIERYRKYASSGEIDYLVRNTGKIMEKIESYFSNYKEKHVDGISVYLKDVWFTLRPSQTEPLVRLIIEGKTKEIVEKYKKIFKKTIEKYDKG